MTLIHFTKDLSRSHNDGTVAVVSFRGRQQEGLYGLKMPPIQERHTGGLQFDLIFLLLITSQCMEYWPFGNNETLIFFWYPFELIFLYAIQIVLLMSLIYLDWSKSFYL